MVDIKRLGSNDDEVTEVIAFMIRLNREARHHVLYVDEEDAALRRTIAEFDLPPQDTFVVARENGTVRGVLGFDADERLGRAWAYGPFVDHAEHQHLAEALWESSVPLLPPNVVEIELAFDVRNKALERFAEEHGMQLYKDMPVLTLRSHDWARVAPKGHRIVNYRDEHLAALEELHEATFPSTFWSAREILERLDDRRRLLVAEGEHGLTGYVYAEVDPPTHQGGIEFLAVAPEERRRGIGNALVEETLGWLFAEPEVDEIFVIVEDDNPAGKALFEGFGFRVIRRMRAFRTQRPLA